jgi:hypothetical protein
MMKCRGMGKMKPITFKKGGTVKDDCYRKVKASYKVFPSAYASGAIAKCRKKKDREGRSPKAVVQRGLERCPHGQSLWPQRRREAGNPVL